ncbi:MAG TPA: lipid IV(A) 3-deoxy-D-manno-octulosonic acid transferase [Pseudomonadales bacterium]|nr:lipid IV(A) 3-deoxy-D-manno-octulosonic acid transferase [Pseudomonadales bacterium]
MLWRALYAVLLLLSYPFVVLLTIWRPARNPAYRGGRRERFGWVHAAAPRDVIWIHAVSAGEVIAAAPLMRRLMTLMPNAPMLVTTMTPTGANQVRRLLGNRVTHCYAPYDYPWALRRFLKRVRPRVLVLIETELWPNMVRMSAARRIPVVLINARMSERSANRYRRIASLTRSMLNRLTWIAAQYPEHATRYIELGARPEIVDVVGNVKFDVELPDDFAERVAALRARWKMTNRPVWIAASTHEGEDQVVLDAHRRVLEREPDALLILVPRHPERFDAVAKLAANGLAVRRMTDGSGGAAQVVIGDTMGQLIYLYGVALVAFIGGSLVEAGGHNPIEPATVGLPLLMGPYDFNFASVTAMFERAGCLHRVTDATLLGQSVSALFDDAPRREAEVKLAREVVSSNAGATDRIARRLARELDESLHVAVVGDRV